MAVRHGRRFTPARSLPQVAGTPEGRAGPASVHFCMVVTATLRELELESATALGSHSWRKHLAANAGKSPPPASRAGRHRPFPSSRAGRRIVDCSRRGPRPCPGPLLQGRHRKVAGKPRRPCGTGIGSLLQGRYRKLREATLHGYRLTFLQGRYRNAGEPPRAARAWPLLHSCTAVTGKPRKSEVSARASWTDRGSALASRTGSVHFAELPPFDATVARKCASHVKSGGGQSEYRLPFGLRSAWIRAFINRE